MRQIILIIFLVSVLVSCNKSYDLPTIHKPSTWISKTIDPYPQVTGGNADSGFFYLLEGKYTGSGVPYDYVEKRLKNVEKWVKRKWILTPDAFSDYYTEDSIHMISGNCFSCHAGEINGEVVLGMGNSLNNNQVGYINAFKFLNWRVKSKYKKDTATVNAYKDFGNFLNAMAPFIKTNNPTVNPAARIAESCMRYRNQENLAYTDSVQYDIREYNLASDTPPLWHLQKKNALYYTAVGRGDFTKLIFQASVLGIKDSTAARKMQEKFVHIIEWINQLEPPKYPKEIDTTLALQGLKIFTKKCSTCHGTYEEPETYPNKVISLDVIKTDPVYAEYAAEGEIVEWYNGSWFSKSEPHSWFEPEEGYMAPPLDGVWATAPYFHNGSVPTIYGVLTSQARPQYWKRTSKDSQDYDWERLGWNTKTKNFGKGSKVYDTTLPGYGNQGHYFGDGISEDDKIALIEYLKML